jgi:hypothetical protein
LKNIRFILRKNSFGVAVLYLTSSMLRPVYSRATYTATHHARIGKPHGTVFADTRTNQNEDKGRCDSAISKGEKKMKGYRMHLWPSIGAALLGSFLIYMAPGLASAACEDPPAPQVNWENCNKKSASLVNADLRGANLRQTNLTGAALGNINLQGADLTEAN